MWLVALGDTLRTTGGNGLDSNNAMPGGGSGGGVRIISDSLAGGGAITALGGVSRTASHDRSGGRGRIRIERVLNNNTITMTPDPSVVDLPPGSVAVLWPPSDAPQVRIVSIGAVNAPADPRAGFGTIGGDVALPQTASTQVIVETTNVEQASQVLVRGTPRTSGRYSEVGAGTPSIVSTDPLVIRWTANLPVQVGYSAVQVKVIRP
jgi:hypothetical protein